MNEFDYIIIGAGSAGAALAARLCETSHRSVLLIEADPRRNHTYLPIPMGYRKVFYDKRLNW